MNEIEPKDIAEKHNRGFELYLRRHNRLEPSVLGELYLVGFLPRKVLISIGSLKGSNGRVWLPGLAFKSILSHKSYGLLFDIPESKTPPVVACFIISFCCRRSPVSVVAIRHIVFYDFYRVRPGKSRHSDGTPHTFLSSAKTAFLSFREKMHLVRAFLDACTAKRTAVAVSLYIKFGNGKTIICRPPLQTNKYRSAAVNRGYFFGIGANYAYSRFL